MDTPQTILNVEDVKQNRDLIRRILESQGYRVVDAETALEGIEKAKHIQPVLILMDINLPDLDGFSAVTRMRSFEHLQKVPIVALTARTVSDDRQRAKAIGCDGYLNKPIDFDELISEVERHIQQGRQLKQDKETDREKYLKEQNVGLIEELERKFTELQIAYDRLKHFEEAKSDFISIASHELKTPLTVIHSYTQMLQMLPIVQQDPSVAEMLSGVSRGVDRMKGIVNDMVSVIRVELADDDFQLAPMSIKNIISAVESEHQINAEEREITLTVEIDDELPTILADGRQLHSALARIVGNGIKYTPDGGTVTVNARYLPKEDEDSAAFIEVVVSDTGVGIDMDKQTVIFDKFGMATKMPSLHSSSKTSFMGGGAGLGLTIARGIIEAHKGRIWVESPGHDPEKLPGSIFHVLLPTQND